MNFSDIFSKKNIAFLSIIIPVVLAVVLIVVFALIPKDTKDTKDTKDSSKNILVLSFDEDDGKAKDENKSQ